MTNGLIINLEGSGCTGKTTVIRRLEETLIEHGHDPVVITNHVIDAYTAGLRETLSLHGGNVSELSKAHVYAAIWSRIDTEVIQPARQTNQIVLLDRWIPTTYFFQAPTGRTTLDSIMSHVWTSTSDLCLHLKCSDMDVIEKRLANRYERVDRYNADFIRNSLQYMPEYVDACKQYANEYVAIETSAASLDEVSDMCNNAILNLVNK